MYRWVEHTAELELEIEAADEGAVLTDALGALAELLLPDGAAAPAGPTERREITVRAGDRPALLAAWMEELVYLAEVEGFVAVAVAHLQLGVDGLRALVSGVEAAAPPIVKAVTYHRLTFAPSAPGYRATVVLDV